jgi:hypothetical protein
VSRRVSLPAADDLFRGGRPMTAVPDPAEVVEPPEVVEVTAEVTGTQEPAKRTSSGRVRHDEKMTVYVTADELLDLEHARLELRRHQGLAVDRGRLVREALVIVLADLEANGDDSVLVQRLTNR